MDSENINDEQINETNKGSTTVKLRVKERNRSQTSVSSNTDINDPENLDYEEEDTAKIDEEKNNDHLSNNLIEKNPSSDQNVQNENDQPLENTNDEQKKSSVVDEKSPIVSDEGELEEIDLEDGEIHDANANRPKNIETKEENNGNAQNLNLPLSPPNKGPCRFFLQGRCHWGSSCKYAHVKNESAKNLNQDISSTATIPPNLSLSMPVNNKAPWISSTMPKPPNHFFSKPHIHGAAKAMQSGAAAGAESAWERGLLSAKTLREQSMRRKQQDKDFNEKKFNLSVRDDATDDKPNEEDLNSTDAEKNESNHGNHSDNRNYSDRYHSFPYPNYSNNHRTNNHNRSIGPNSNHDHRARHSDDYSADRRRQDKPSMKNHTRHDDVSSYKRNSIQKQYSTGSHHDTENSSHSHNNNRRADDWQDPWDRSRTYRNSKKRRGSGGNARKPSYSSSSRSSSSSSRSVHSRSYSTSSSSRSRSRSKRRSSSMGRSNRSTEPIKNGNQKKSNDSTSKPVQLSPPPTANKFLPGRQISSHTLKKAEKSSNHSHSSSNHHGKNSKGRGSKKRHKKHLNQSDSSSSSSSSSDSDTHRASSSSSDSSSSENETQTSSAPKTKSGSKLVSTNHTEKSNNRQTASSSGGTTSVTRNSKSDSSKKRRDTSSSAGSASTSTKKKTKLTSDSQKSSGESNNDSESKIKRQKLLREIHETENLISQRSTKTSS